MDKDHIPKLISEGKSAAGLAAAHKTAARALSDAGAAPFPTNACAATLSALLQQAGIDVAMTLGAGKLAYRLSSPKQRAWQEIDVRQQKPGDVGVTYDLGGNEGADHIYLVLECPDSDKMLIADNQNKDPHYRFASGKGRTPTEYFLRAPGA